MRPFSFRPHQRLLNKADFDRVFQKAEHRASSGPILILCRSNNLDHPRLGLVVRKKMLKRAVDRNRLKRLAREAFRLRQHDLPKVDIVVLNRSAFKEDDFQRAHHYVNRAFDKLTDQTRVTG